MDLPGTIRSQYLAALAMLEQAIVHCPESLWDSPDDTTRFWHVAYHALFYTHLYLQDTEASFTPWARHRAEYNFIGQLPWPPHAPPQIGEPYDKAAIQEYLAFCRREVEQRVPHLDLSAGSGFDWLPFDKLELQFYTIRHIQQHAGELMERLGSRAGIELRWVGTSARP
jgi:hypothetical protein